MYVSRRVCFRCVLGGIAMLFMAALAGCGNEGAGVAPPDIEIESAVMPVLAPGQTTAAIYLSIRNNTDEPAVVNYIYAAISDHIEVHRNIYEEGMMKMRPVPHVSIPAHGTMQFAPNGYHLMVFGISSTPSAGDQFSLTIEFEGGRVATGNVNVRPLAL